MDPPKIKQAWARRGYTFHRQIDKPGKAWAAHFHSVDEIVMPVKGRVIVEVAGKARRPAVGRSLVVPRRAVHRIRNTQSSPVHYLYGFRSKRAS